MIKRFSLRRGHLTGNVAGRGGFTLIELLVVVSILVVLAGITITAVSFNSEADRIRKGASQLRSFLKGAQNRAVFSNAPVGVRLYLDDDIVTPDDGVSVYGRTVSRIAYIGARNTWSSARDSGRVDLKRVDADNDGIADGPDVLIVEGVNHGTDPQATGWPNLYNRGFLTDNLRIRIPNDTSGNWYPFSFDTNTNQIKLGLPYATPQNPSPDVLANENQTYEIELAWQVLPEEPCILPPGVVIDLDASKVPLAWRPQTTGTAAYTETMDIMFSAQGNVIEAAAGNGLIHLYVCDREDSLALKQAFVSALDNELGAGSGRPHFDNFVAGDIPFVPLDEVPNLSDTAATGATSGSDWVGQGDNTYVLNDRRLVTIFAQTGNVVVNRVNAYVGAGGGSPDSNDSFDYDDDATPGEPDGLADDPYRFAETGEEVTN